VLTIFLAGGRSEEESPWFYEGTTAELFRTVRVIGEQVVFVEPSPGHLINVAHIERIAEDQPEELDATAREAQRVLDEYDAGQPEEVELVDRGVPASPMLGTKSCPHGNMAGTCMECLGEVL
jgi:hypothetical protein